MSLVNTQVYDQSLDTVLGSANVVSTDGSARLNITIDSGGSGVYDCILYFW